MLTDHERAKLRGVLVAERERLLRNAKDGIKFAMNRENNVGRDSIDESMEEELFSTELRLRDREKFLLRKIDEAIGRVDDKSISECESCGEPIGYKRLMARPVTTLCIECKEESEKAEQAQSQVGRAGGTAAEHGLGGDEIGGHEES